MNQLESLIGTVIGSALDRAAHGASGADLAHGLLAALRRLRTVVSVQAGYGAACALDDSIHELFLERALDAFGQDGEPADRVALPPRGLATARACAILEDAAMSCLMLNAFFPGNTALSVAVRAMALRLIDSLGGVPDWTQVVAELRAPEADADDTASEDQWSSPAVH